MDFHIPDYVRITIAGNSVTPYIISYSRKDDLCELSESFELQLSLTCPYTINPYNDVLIEELYNGSTGYVLRGYIVETDKNYEEGILTIRGLDKSVLLDDYFIPQNLTSTGQTVDYWINYLISLTGLSTHFDVSSVYIVENETPLGFQTVADAVMKLERQAAYYIKYDSQNDYIKIFRLGNSQTVLTITTNDVVDAKRSTGTENTRNVVKVFGGYKYNILDGSSTQVFAKARSGMPELLVDKTAAIVSPVLRSQTYAYIVANRILSVVNGLDDEQLYMLAGFYPTVHVGECVYIDVNFANLEFHGNRMITSIETNVSSDGAFTTIGVGKKCPRISINLPDPPVFVTDSVNGVGVSWNGGDSFLPSNTGLTGDALDAYGIAVNQWGQSMVLTKDGLYRRYGTGGTWSKLSELPDPVNTAGDYPTPTVASGITFLKVVDEPTGYGKFHVLAREDAGPLRSWIYTTKNFGMSWDSEELWINKTPSGYLWNIYPIDIEVSPTNNVYTLVNASQPKSGIYYTHQTSPYSFDLCTWSSETDPTVKHTIYDYDVSTRNCRIYSIPYNRRIAYAIQVLLFPAGYSCARINIHKTTDFGDTWTEIYNQVPSLPLPIEPDTFVYYYSWQLLFDTSSTTNEIRFTQPFSSSHITSIKHTNGTVYYTHTQYFYDGGYTFTIDSSGNVIEGSYGPTYSGSETWETLDQWGAGSGYFGPGPGPYGTWPINKYSPTVGVSYDWTDPYSGYEYPPGEDYSYMPDPRITTYDVYSENNANYINKNDGTFSYLSGMSGLNINYAYDDGYAYRIYYDTDEWWYFGYGDPAIPITAIDEQVAGPSDIPLDPIPPYGPYSVWDMEVGDPD